MKTIVVTDDNRQDAIKAACEVLKAGGIVAYPTETFYGLGVRFDSEDALRRLALLKGRTSGKPMALIAGSKDMVAEISPSPGQLAERLMQEHWPGPLTLVINAREGVSEHITTRGTVAVRVPGESFALELARAYGHPITATSANPSGTPPPSDAEAVTDYFSEGIDLLVDAGPTPGGAPSSIVDTTGEEPRVLRGKL